MSFLSSRTIGLSVKQHAPHADRSKGPIVEVLRRVLPEVGVALEEIGCVDQELGDVFFGDGGHGGHLASLGSGVGGNVDGAFEHGGGRPGHAHRVELLRGAAVSQPEAGR